MSGSAMRLRRSGRYRTPVVPGPMILKPVHTAELKRALGPESHHRPPFRPVGANSAATDCTSSPVGTVVDLSALDRILNVDPIAATATVQPGVRIGV